MAAVRAVVAVVAVRVVAQEAVVEALMVALGAYWEGAVERVAVVMAVVARVAVMEEQGAGAAAMAAGSRRKSQSLRPFPVCPSTTPWCHRQTSASFADQ